MGVFEKCAKMLTYFMWLLRIIEKYQGKIEKITQCRALLSVLFTVKLSKSGYEVGRACNIC